MAISLCSTAGTASDTPDTTEKPGKNSEINHSKCANKQTNTQGTASRVFSATMVFMLPFRKTLTYR